MKVVKIIAASILAAWFGAAAGVGAVLVIAPQSFLSSYIQFAVEAALISEVVWITFLAVGRKLKWV